MQNRKIKLLYIASDNNASSGAFLSMVKLCTILKNKYFVYPYIILPCDGDGTSLLVKNGLEYRIIRSEDWIITLDCPMHAYLKKIKKNLKNILAIYKIAKIIKNKQIDIVHINTIYSYVGAIAALLTNTPLVWHIREILKEAQNRKFLYAPLGYWLINKSTRIIMISNCVAKKYKKIKSDNTIVIHNGIDEKIFQACDRNIFQNKKLHFLCVGAIDLQKGQIELIKACHKLKADNINNWSLLIIGKGKTDYLESLIKEYDLENQINILGYQSNVQYFMKVSDITFVPSHCEAFGRVTVEAMMAGCLVIATNSGGTPEIIKDKETGLLFKPQNPEDLFKTIKFAISNIELVKNIAKQGQKHALQNFNATQNAKKIRLLYDEIWENREK